MKIDRKGSQRLPRHGRPNVGEPNQHKRKKVGVRNQQKAKSKQKRPAEMATGSMQSDRCSTCNMVELPSDLEDEPVDWICCDSCACWNHMFCVGVGEVPRKWQCQNCIEPWK